MFEKIRIFEKTESVDYMGKEGWFLKKTMGKKNEVLSREEFGVSKGYAWENNMSANPFDLVHIDI